MSSFATDVDVAQKPMCTRKTMEKAVDTLNQALQESPPEGQEKTADPADKQLKLSLGRGSQQKKPEQPT